MAKGIEGKLGQTDENLLLATAHGVVIFQPDSGYWQVLSTGLAEHHVTSVIADKGMILAGTQNGIYRSDDLGRNWTEVNAGLNLQHIRWLAVTPGASPYILAGTEPAGIFVSHDRGESWQACPQVAQLRDQFGWFLPYSPKAGCVRDFALHEQRVYAAVEVGGVLITKDNGKSWDLVAGSPGDTRLRMPEPFVHPDVHSIAVHPTSLDLVYAVTGGGLYRSWDGGQTWQNRYHCYCRAAWVDPADPDHILLGPADGVDRNGRIEVSDDGGHNWHPADTGLNIPWRRHLVERFTQINDILFAVLSNGELLTSPLDALHWRQILPNVPGVNALVSLIA